MKNPNLCTTLKADVTNDLTSKMAKDIIKYVSMYENIPNHIEVLSTPLLGGNKMHFHPKDALAIFNIMKINPSQLRKFIHAAKDFDTSFIVSTDPFNVLCLWITYLSFHSKLSIRDKEKVQVAILKLLHYKFFTGVVNHNLPDGADQGVMQYTIDHMNSRFDIKQHKTWYALITDKCNKILDKKGLHFKTLRSFTENIDVVKEINDIQTRIRNQLILFIYNEYRPNLEKGNTVVGTNMIDEINGDKMLRAIESTMDSMIVGVTGSVSNLDAFLDFQYIDYAARLTNDVTTDGLVHILTKFSEIANIQHKKHLEYKVGGSKSKPIYIGYNVLITNILQKTYRLCMMDRSVNLNSRASIINRTQTIYRNSRVKNEDISAIKASIDDFIKKHSKSRRDATNVGFKLAFVAYIMMLSFNYMD